MHGGMQLYLGSFKTLFKGKFCISEIQVRILFYVIPSLFLKGKSFGSLKVLECRHARDRSRKKMGKGRMKDFG